VVVVDGLRGDARVARATGKGKGMEKGEENMWKLVETMQNRVKTC
jgi:hypothetical protein